MFCEKQLNPVITPNEYHSVQYGTGAKTILDGGFKSNYNKVNLMFGIGEGEVYDDPRTD